MGEQCERTQRRMGRNLFASAERISLGDFLECQCAVELRGKPDCVRARFSVRFDQARHGRRYPPISLADLPLWFEATPVCSRISLTPRPSGFIFSENCPRPPAAVSIYRRSM